VPNDNEIKTTLLTARYGTEHHERQTPVAWNQTMELLVRHRTVRQYLDRPVDDSCVNALAVAAQSGASSSNLQTWSVVAVRDTKTIAAISQICTQTHVATAPLIMIWLVDYSRVHAIAAHSGENAESLNYLDTFISGVFDAGIAAQNAVVAAESLGLGTVYLGSIRNNVNTLSTLLNLPQHIMPVVGLSVGWPDLTEDADIKPRLPMKAVLHHETYDSDAFEPALAEYEPISADYYRRFNLGESWTERVHERAVDGRSERNKAYMTAWLKEHGFGLK
jgi:nitroreductase